MDKVSEVPGILTLGAKSYTAGNWGQNFVFPGCGGTFAPKRAKKTHKKGPSPLAGVKKVLFLNGREAFFVHIATRYLRRTTGREWLPPHQRSDKIVFLQQSRRKPFADSLRAIILQAFVYLYEKFHQADQERRNRNRLGHRGVHFYR
jgi:hypothetical protein